MDNEKNEGTQLVCFLVLPKMMARCAHQDGARFHGWVQRFRACREERSYVLRHSIYLQYEVSRYSYKSTLLTLGYPNMPLQNTLLRQKDYSELKAIENKQTQGKSLYLTLMPKNKV